MFKKRIIAFGVIQEEKECFEKYKESYNEFDISIVNEGLNPKNVEKCKGYDGVIFIGGCQITKEVLQKLKEYGIKYISSRSIGYDNVDLQAAKELGIKVSNGSYSPFSVAEFALMSGMLLLRNIPQSIRNSAEYNFSLKGLIGREMRSLTIGIIGTGKIGGAAIDTLENEKGIFFKDCREKDFDNPYLKELLKMKNVFITSHHAFYTTQAVSDMVESALRCQKEFFETGKSENQL